MPTSASSIGSMSSSGGGTSSSGTSTSSGGGNALGAIAGVGALAGGIVRGYGGMLSSNMQAELADFNSGQYMMDAKLTRMNAKAQAEAIRRNAGMQAGAIREQGDLQAKQLRKAGRKLEGQQRVGYAKSGVRMEGTPLEVMNQTATNIELDAMERKEQADFQARGIEEAADFNIESLEKSAEWQARQAELSSDFQADMVGRHKKAGKLAMISGVLGGVTQAAGMFSS